MTEQSIKQGLAAASRAVGAGLLSAALVLSLSPGLAFAGTLAAQEGETTEPASATDTGSDASTSTDSSASTVAEGAYVMMNIPYADFYAAEATNNSVEVDVVTSATNNKWSAQSGTYYQELDTGGQILGVTFLVKIGSGTDTATLGGTEAEDVDSLAELGDYSYYVVGTDADTASAYSAFYKELTVTDDGVAFSDTTGVTSSDTTTTTTLSTDISTSSRYGDYELDFESLGVTDTVIGMTVYANTEADGSGTETGYGMRHLENIWKSGSENSWGSGFLETETKGNTLSYEHYLSMMGTYITHVEVITLSEVLDVQLEETQYVAPKFELTLSDAADDAGYDYDLAVAAYSDLELAYDAGDLGITVSSTQSSANEGSTAFPERTLYNKTLALDDGATAGAYTLTVTSGTGDFTYSETADITLTTDAQVVTWASNGYDIADADETDAYAVSDFVEAISAVTVNGTEYSASSSSSSGLTPFAASESSSLSTQSPPDMDSDSLPGSSSSSAVTLYAEDGTLDTSATDDDDAAIFAAIGTYSISIASDVFTAGLSGGVYENSTISTDSLELSSTSATYTGSAIELPSVSIATTDGSTIGCSVTWADESGAVVTEALEPGTYTATVDAGDYGTAEVTFTVEQIDLSEAEVTLEADTYAYTGQAIEPAVTSVAIDGEEVDASYYTVAYSDNVSNTTGTVTVTAAGDYATGSASATFTIDIYVMMNIPYADFYASDEAIDTTTIDIVSSATASKWASRTGTYYEECSYDESTGTECELGCLNPGGGHILGVTYLVKLGTAVDSLDDVSTAFEEAVATTSDAIATAGDYAYYAVVAGTDFAATADDGTAEAAYYLEIEATSSGPSGLTTHALSTQAPGGTIEESYTYSLSEVMDYATQEAAVATELVDTDYTVETSTTYGDYQIDFGTDVEYEVTDSFANTIYGAAVYTTDGTGYALRQLENLWATSKHGMEFSWAFTEGYLQKNSNYMAYEHYVSMMGKSIESVTVYTSGGVYSISFGNAADDGTTAAETLFVQTIYDADDFAVADGLTSDASVAVTLPAALPSDIEVVYSVEGWDATTVNDGQLAIPSGTLPGTYTLTLSDANGAYVAAEASFTLSTEQVVVTAELADDGALSLVAASGASEEDLANYLANISSVSVDGTSYSTSGRNSTTIVNSDGSIALDATVSSGQGQDATSSALFAESGTYTLVISADGYADVTLEVTVEVTTAEETAEDGTTTTTTSVIATAVSVNGVDVSADAEAGEDAGGTEAGGKAAKKANTAKIKAKKTVKVKYKKLKKKAQSVKAITVKKAKGKVTYKKLKGSSKKLSVTKAGKVKVKKGTKKGTYKIKVKVTVKGNSSYAAKSKTVTIKVKVK